MPHPRGSTSNRRRPLREHARKTRSDLKKVTVIKHKRKGEQEGLEITHLVVKPEKKVEGVGEQPGGKRKRKR